MGFLYKHGTRKTRCPICSTEDKTEKPALKNFAGDRISHLNATGWIRITRNHVVWKVEGGTCT